MAVQLQISISYCIFLKKRLLGHFSWHFKFTISLFLYEFFSSWYIFSLKDFVHKVENSMHHYIFFSFIDVKFLDDDVIIFSGYSVIIFGINSLKSIAIFKIFTLVFFIHNVKMWNPLNIVCYALHQNFDF